MLNSLSSCTLCPRKCGVNRLKGQLGFCKASKEIKIAKACLYPFEEPCISGSNGSGTIFFSNCNLSCVFCQNHEISSSGIGVEISSMRLSEIFLELKEKGAHNINLVTPTHYVPQIIEALKLSKAKGLNIPILYNSNGYDSVSTIKSLKNYIDVYLPDLKYFNNKYGEKYSLTPNYFSFASKAISEMVAQVGNVKFSKDGLIEKGVIIRHLMLPGLLFDSKKIMDYIYKNFGDSVYFSLMNQYTPMHKAKEYEELNRTLNIKHYDSLINYCVELGLTNGFIQGSGTSSKDFVPDFNLKDI